MAMRLPVVTTNAGGLSEVFEDGRNAIVVPARDDRALADGIRRLLRDADLARRLAEAGRRSVESEFTVDWMVERTIAFYEGVMSLSTKCSGP